jgi:uncharacterized RDD family membrane protein YckC
MSRHSAQTSSVGTVHYMAPEVGSGNYSRGIDIYALGVILYEMLLGKVPFEGSSMGEVLMKHLTAQPEVDQLPQPFGQVIRKALAKDPNQRFQNVDEMVEVLLGVDAIKESVVGFDAASLSGVARQAVGDWLDSPMPSPNPAPRPPFAQPAAARLGGVAFDPADAPGPLGKPAVADVFVPKPFVTPVELSPEAATGKLYYAGFWIRVAAALIDALVVGAGSAVLLLLLHAPTENNPLFLAASIAYEGLLVGRWNGQTLGKRACGIKVISANGRPCGPWQAFARALAGWLNMFTLGLTYLMVAFSDRKRALHDHIAGTLHVYALD